VGRAGCCFFLGGGTLWGYAYHHLSCTSRSTSTSPTRPRVGDPRSARVNHITHLRTDIYAQATIVRELYKPQYQHVSDPREIAEADLLLRSLLRQFKENWSSELNAFVVAGGGAAATGVLYMQCRVHPKDRVNLISISRFHIHTHTHTQVSPVQGELGLTRGPLNSTHSWLRAGGAPQQVFYMCNVG